MYTLWIYISFQYLQLVCQTYIYIPVIISLLYWEYIFRVNINTALIIKIHIILERNKQNCFINDDIVKKKDN